MAKKRTQPKDEHGLPSLALVFGYIAVKELQRLQDKIRILSRLGYGNAEIAAICDASPAVVAALKYRSAKSPRRRTT